MRNVVQRRPSPAMVVALLALVVAMSGTAVATVAKVNGDSLIKKGTLSGDRLRKHTLTGRLINLGKLGNVPSARHADSATNATNAVNASNATNAGNAAALGGQPASSYLTTGSRIGTNGIVKVGGTASGATVTLFNYGPFTMTMTCTTANNNNDTSVSLSARSSEAGAAIDNIVNPSVNTPVSVGPSTQPTGGPLVQNDFVFSFEAPSGAQAVLSGSYGVNSVGVSNGCWANLAGIA